MFILGHVLITGNDNFKTLDVSSGEGVVMLMLPDLLSSHTWGYEQCWNIPQGTLGAKLIQAHIVGDAVIHFGPKWATPPQKIGWAYRNMRGVVNEYRNFYREAEEAGYIVDGREHDSLRGWAHTMIEYSVDQYLTDTLNLDRTFVNIRDSFAALEQNLDWLDSTVREYGIETTKPYPQQPLRYAGVICQARTPDEFHLRGLAAKFGLEPKNEVLSKFRNMLREIIRSLGKDEMARIVDELTNVLASPATYDYPLPQNWVQG